MKILKLRIKNVSFLILLSLAANTWSQEICQPLLNPVFKDEAGHLRIPAPHEIKQMIELNEEVIIKRGKDYCELESNRLSGLISCDLMEKDGEVILCSSSIGQNFRLDNEGFPLDSVLLFSGETGSMLMNIEVRRNLPKGKKIIKWPLNEILEVVLSGQEISISSNESTVNVRFKKSKIKKQTCKTLLLSNSELICDGQSIYQF